MVFDNFRESVGRAVDAAGLGTIFDKMGVGSIRQFMSVGNLIENNWRNGHAGYQQHIRKYLAQGRLDGQSDGGSPGGRSDLLQRTFDHLRQKVDAVNARYSKQYGWGRTTPVGYRRSGGFAELPTHGPTVSQDGEQQYGNLIIGETQHESLMTDCR